MTKEQVLSQLAEQEKLETSPAILSGKYEQPISNRFDPRTEVSADAKHVASKIVRHMWTIFIVMPVVFGILYSVMTAK